MESQVLDVEFEDVNGKIQGEACRVAAAFEGTIEQARRFQQEEYAFLVVTPAHFQVASLVCARKGLAGVAVVHSSNTDEVCDVALEEVGSGGLLEWRCHPHPQLNETMARGLYRLGFEENIVAQFAPLTAHEKLELRLSMPRDFWPQTWREDEAK